MIDKIIETCVLLMVGFIIPLLFSKHDSWWKTPCMFMWGVSIAGMLGSCIIKVWSAQ